MHFCPHDEYEPSLPLTQDLSQETRQCARHPRPQLCESDSDIEGRTPQTEASTPVHQKFVLLSKSLKCPTPFLSVKSSIL